MTPDQLQRWESLDVARGQIETILSDYRKLGARGVKTKNWIVALGVLIKAGKEEHFKGDIPDWQLKITADGAAREAERRTAILKTKSPAAAGMKSGSIREWVADEKIKMLIKKYLEANPLPKRNATAKAIPSPKAIATWYWEREGKTEAERANFVKNLVARINRLQTKAVARTHKFN